MLNPNFSWCKNTDVGRMRLAMGLNSRGPGLQCRRQRGGGGEEVALGGAFADAGETWDDPGNLWGSSWRIMKESWFT
jgi:hypothetical protein